MMRFVVAPLIVAFLLAGCGSNPDHQAGDAAGDGSLRGSAKKPLRVLLIPADGGTEDGTIADFQPVFTAITREYDLHFDIKVAQSYNAVVEGMANGQLEVAWFGPVTYHLAKQRGAAELLAVGVSRGESVYYSGIFVRKEAGLKQIEDLKGKSVAFGDVNSTSSFNYPVAMILAAGLDPVRDLDKIYMTGGHANALAALAAGKVDAACASFSSFEKAIANGQVDPDQVVTLARSEPIPYPPMAMHVNLDASIKRRLREAFGNVHRAEGVTPDMIRGYGGKTVDRYDARFSESEFDRAMEFLAGVTDELKTEILKKASEK